MKKCGLVQGIFALGLICSLSMGNAWAEQPTDQQIRAVAIPVTRIKANGRQTKSDGKVALIIDGVPFNFHEAKLVEKDGQLMVPLRAVCEAIGAQVSFDLKMGIARVNGKGRFISIKFDGAPRRTMFPLAPLCASLNVQLTNVSRDGLLLLSIDTTLPNPAVEPIAQKPAPPTAQPETSNPAKANADQTNTDNANTDDANLVDQIQYNLERINSYRAKAGVPALHLDDQLSAFAKAGSLELMKDHLPHNHFIHGDIWNNGFTSNAAENQGDPHGWTPGPVDKVIDEILQSMMNEGPGGGHHDNILNPKFQRMGVGLVEDGEGKLYLTNDFSA